MRFAALTASYLLADEGSVERKRVAEAIAKYGIETERANPGTV